MKLGLLAIIVGAIILVTAVQVSLKYARFDLTENKLYTLSQGTVNTLEHLQKPVDLYFFFSEQTTKNIPAIRNYAKRVEELLDEYELKSKGKIKLHKIDPEPFSESEDQAAEFGLQAIPVSLGGDTVYFGLAGKAENGDKQMIPFFQEDKEKFLEYDVSQLVYRLSTPKKRVIGLISGLQLQGGFDMASRQPLAPWVIMDQIEKQFEVQSLGADLKEVPSAVDVLMIVHPKRLTDQALYAIDQYVLQGGKTLVFVDPSSEMDQDSMMGASEKGSDISKLFTAWGIQLEPNKVIADWALALKVSMQQGALPQRHLGFLSLHKESFSAESILTNQLEMVNLGTSGILKKKEASKVEFEPLLSSSNEAMLLEAVKFDKLIDPSVLLQDFKPTGETYVAAARIQGMVASAFPNGAPALKEPANAETGEMMDDDASYNNNFQPQAIDSLPMLEQLKQKAEDMQNEQNDPSASDEQNPSEQKVPTDKAPEESSKLKENETSSTGGVSGFFISSALADEAQANKAQENKPQVDEKPDEQKNIVHLTESKQPVNVIVVADTDILSDRLWVRVQDFFGQRVAVPWANNGDFVVNMLDMLSGSADLIGLRSRGEFTREFTKVKKLQDQAESLFREKEQELKKQLQETEAQLSELQKPSEDGSPIHLTAEQEAALKKFVEDKLRIRKELRDVQHQLDKDIRALGTTLKVINILIMPIVLTILMFIFAGQIRKRRLKYFA